MALRIAVKRLSAVETDPSRSHQHEFHAGELRRELELPAVKQVGGLDLLILRDDGGSPIVESTTFTLYNARENKPARSAEWRLYYATDVIAESASGRDLLILYRHEDRLRAVVVPTGSSAESEFLRALELGDLAVRERFVYLDVPVPDEREGRELAGQLTLSDAVPTTYAATDHALFSRASREQHVPGTVEMASAATDIVRVRGITPTDPDRYLDAVLAAESELYFAIEGNVQQTRLNELVAGGASLAGIMDFSISVQQSRRARRGQSLQNHFATLLADRDIPFTAQCDTERGETPDFLIPGCHEYHDQGYPPAQLRMVACKSTAKERWRQVLNEAERIPDKYLLTVDTDLTAPVIRAMAAARLYPFLPSPTIMSAYAANPERARLGTVAELLDQLTGALENGNA